jgi:hypothetical protein
MVILDEEKEIPANEFNIDSSHIIQSLRINKEPRTYN